MSVFDARGFDRDDVIRAFVEGTKDGNAVEFQTIGGDLALVRHRFAELAPRLENPGITGLLGHMERPGVCYLQRYLELTHFPPFTEANKCFECFILKWAELQWSLTLLPRDSLDVIVLRDAIGKAGLVAKRCVPIAVFGDPPPLRSGTIPSPEAQLFAEGFVEMDLPFKNLVLLENVPGHLVYRDPRAAFRRETELLEEVERKWKVRRYGT